MKVYRRCPHCCKHLNPRIDEMKPITDVHWPACHTPGPYESRYTHGVGWSLHVKSDFDGKLPGATIRVATAIGNERDACLLQAAPDLLEAIRNIVATKPSGYSSPEFVAARAAIYKATGGAS